MINFIPLIGKAVPAVLNWLGRKKKKNTKVGPAFFDQVSTQSAQIMAGTNPNNTALAFQQSQGGGFGDLFRKKDNTVVYVLGAGLLLFIGYLLFGRKRI